MMVPFPFSPIRYLAPPISAVTCNRRLACPSAFLALAAVWLLDACRMGAAKDANGMWIGNSCHGGLALAGRLITGAHGAAANWPHLQLPAPLPQELMDANAGVGAADASRPSCRYPALKVIMSG